MNDKGENTLLVVDDDPYVLESISTLLKSFNYKVHACQNANDAMNLVKKTAFDVVLTDIKMPQVTGIELLRYIHAYDQHIPVLLMTAFAELDVAVDAIKQGAFDFITKPYNPDYLLHSVEKAVKYTSFVQMEKNYKTMLEDTVRLRTQELADALLMVKKMSAEVIQRLTSVAEYRDTDTGAHIARIGLYSNKIAEAMGMSSDFVETITFASPMHDLGKIGIPDSILHKPDTLTAEEWTVMRKHPQLAYDMLYPIEYLRPALDIPYTHHEKWDGTGYPRGLKGEDIPMTARLFAVMDVWDALTSDRPYRPAWSEEEALTYIREQSGRHFDPQVVELFFKVIK